jgi:ribose 5-phosphate isomerase B
MVMNNSQNGNTSEELIIGIAADHGGFELKEYLLPVLRDMYHKIIDFGNYKLNPKDDYPDFIIPMAKELSEGRLTHGIAICGSGVGACILGNKIKNVRAGLIHEKYSAHQGVEDDNMNMICLGGRVLDPPTALELVTIFLGAKFRNEEKYIRRLAKLKNLEK